MEKHDLAASDIESDGSVARIAWSVPFLALAITAGYFAFDALWYWLQMHAFDEAPRLPYREIRWGRVIFQSVATLLTGGIAVSLLVAAGRAKRRAVELRTRRAQYPNAPWQWNSKWDDRRVGGSSRVVMIVSWVASVVLGAPMIAQLFLIPGEIAKKGNYLPLIALLFPALGGALVWWAVHSTLRYRKFGRTMLLMTNFPPSIGKQLRASMEIPHRFEADDEFTVMLRCVRSVVVRSGSNKTTHDTDLHKGAVFLPKNALIAAGTGWQLPFAIDIPPNLPVTQDIEPNISIRWDVEIVAKTKGVDFREVFDLPVFDAGGG